MKHIKENTYIIVLKWFAPEYFLKMIEEMYLLNPTMFQETMGEY